MSTDPSKSDSILYMDVWQRRFDSRHRFSLYKPSENKQVAQLFTFNSTSTSVLSDGVMLDKIDRIDRVGIDIKKLIRRIFYFKITTCASQPLQNPSVKSKTVYSSGECFGSPFLYTALTVSVYHGHRKCIPCSPFLYTIAKHTKPEKMA